MRAKRESLKILINAIRENKVDDDIIDLLFLINSINGVYTTSSCSGRMGVIEEPGIGAKPLARWLLKEQVNYIIINFVLFNGIDENF